MQQKINELQAMIDSKKNSADKLDLLLVRNWEREIKQIINNDTRGTGKAV